MKFNSSLLESTGFFVFPNWVGHLPASQQMFVRFFVSIILIFLILSNYKTHALKVRVDLSKARELPSQTISCILEKVRTKTIHH